MAKVRRLAAPIFMISAEDEARIGADKMLELMREAEAQHRRNFKDAQLDKEPEPRG